MALGMDYQGRGFSKLLRPRVFGAGWLVVVAFGLLMVRLYTLQIQRGDELTNKGRRNFVQRLRTAHDRGIIFDRYGRILVDNRPSLDAQVIPAFLGKREEARATLRRLAGLAGLTAEELARVQEQVESRRGLERFKPVLFKRDLQADQVDAIESERSIFSLDGVEILEGRRRTYVHGKLAAHLLGYVNEIDAVGLEAERQNGNPEGYELGDLLGRDGIERAFEKELRGVDGYHNTVVDAKGRRQFGPYVDALLGQHRDVDPEPGHNVFLTIDMDLQRVAEEAFEGSSAGSVVVLDARNGAVLALASVPAYDVNLVSGVLNRETKAKLDNDPLKPWMNRAIQGQYAPGSTFKIFTGLAALAEGVLSGHEKVFCPGFFKMGRHVWRCHKDSGHGPVDLREALKVSCDTYFYSAAARTGINPIAAMGLHMNLGRPTGIRLRGEKSGIMPNEDFHNRVDRATGGYQRGMAINTAIGQGSVLVTPIQLVVAYAAVGNGGVVLRPEVVDRIETADYRVTRRFFATPSEAEFEAAKSGDDSAPGAAAGNQIAGVPLVQEFVQGKGPEIVRGFTAQIRERLNLPEGALQQVQEGLKAVVNEPGGTAFARRLQKVSIAGKTGTAQVVRLGRERVKTQDMDYFERDHAWFAAYAPAESAEIAVVVINEHSGHGGSMAAPIAARVIEAYFDLKEKRMMSAPAAAVVEAAP